MLASTGPKVDNVVRRPNGLFIVLDHDHGVAQVAQPQQRRQQTPVVALIRQARSCGSLST